MSESVESLTSKHPQRVSGNWNDQRSKTNARKHLNYQNRYQPANKDANSVSEQKQNSMENQENEHNSVQPQNEPPHDKTNKMTCAPSEDSDQPSLIRVFTVRSVGS